MQKVIIEIDWYTKVILTLIAILLAGVFAKSYFPSHIREGRASDVGNFSRGLTNEFGWSDPGKLYQSESGLIGAKVSAEGSRVLVDCLYLFSLQNFSEERALAAIDESPILSLYPAGKEYAKFLVVAGRPAYLSGESIKTALLSGRFEVTLNDIVPKPLKVEVMNGSVGK